LENAEYNAKRSCAVFFFSLGCIRGSIATVRKELWRMEDVNEWTHVTTPCMCCGNAGTLPPTFPNRVAETEFAVIMWVCEEKII
jgi:hypothetical protein